MGGFIANTVIVCGHVRPIYDHTKKLLTAVYNAECTLEEYEAAMSPSDRTRLDTLRAYRATCEDVAVLDKRIAATRSAGGVLATWLELEGRLAALVERCNKNGVTP